MKLFNSLLLIAALVCASLTAFSQASVGTGGGSLNNYANNTLTFPFATLATATATNLGLGWNTTNSYTNVITGWNVNSNAFVNTTNITTVVTTNYAIINATKSRNVGISEVFAMMQNTNGGGSENIVTWWIPSVDGLNWNNDAAAMFTASFKGHGTTAVTGTTNLDTLGYGWWKLNTLSNGTSGTLTNHSMSYSTGKQ